ncbi:phage terminase large subunit [Bacteroides thetaiotaomicron]|uniref:phage terminase large subunit n=1 Tax=Bacteroides thetaiotaomicron TaxID=818 RepID=UPI0039C1894B
MNRLKAPTSLNINFKPSPKQYEVWKALQPECPECGGEVVQVPYGKDKYGHTTYHPQCSKCKTTDLPQFILCGGAAGGGKSFLMSAWLIYSCMRFPGIRTVVARKTLKSLKESTVNTIRGLLREWGLKEDENYHINNLEGNITFWNDSKIIYLEMADNPSDLAFNRFGSMEVTAVVVDEVSEISEKACEVLFSRIRYKTHETFKIPKMVMSTNPCTTWVRDRFVQDEEGNKVKCREGERYIPFGVEDNPDEKFRMTYMASLDKISDPAVKARLRYGNWDFPESNEAAAYWNFDGGKHLLTELKEKTYDPTKPLILSFDFNVAPYMSCLMAQMDYENKIVYILEEIIGRPEDKENNTPKLADKIKRKLLLMGHIGGIIVTGDPAGMARSTTNEEGINNYSIIVSRLDAPQLRPKKKLLSKSPPQKTRLEFVNSILAGKESWNILIDIRCRKLTEDLINQRKEMDGSKSKAKVMDSKLGIKYEKYGHLSDALDCLLVLFLNEQWRKFNSNGSCGITTFNGTPIYGSFDY